MSPLQSHRQQNRRKSRDSGRSDATLPWLQPWQCHIARVTVADLIARELRRDGARPFLTWYDDSAGARVELSVATTANWAAKIANHLADELDLQPGDEVVVDPALHWSNAVVLLGAWTAGCRVTFGEDTTMDIDPDPMGVGLSRLVGAQPDEVVVPVAVSGDPALTLGN